MKLHNSYIIYKAQGFSLSWYSIIFWT